MDKDKKEWISTNTDCTPYQVVSGYMGNVPVIGSLEFNILKRKLVTYTRPNKSPRILMSPTNTNAVKAPELPSNTTNILTQVIMPNQTDNNPVISQIVDVSSVPCNITDLSPDAIVLNDDPNGTTGEQNASYEFVIQFLTALLQDSTSPIGSDSTKIWPSDVQQAIANMSQVVDHIFATSSDSILITLPCTPGFETEKISPAKIRPPNRLTLEHGTASSFNLSDECILEKKFNMIFHQLSANVLSNVSTESEIRKCICRAMNEIMQTMPLKDALSLVCNCSLCWFLYMCAKVIYRECPEESPRLNWSGCPISSYRCLAMRRIVITDVNSDIDQDTNVNSCFSLQLRFKRGGQKQKLFKQTEHFKSFKRKIDSLDSGLNKVSRITVRTGVNADSKKASRIRAITGLNAHVPVCSLNITSGHSMTNNAIEFNYKVCPRFQSPEEDVYVFNPVRQFKGNTYTRRKN